MVPWVLPSWRTTLTWLWFRRAQACTQVGAIGAAGSPALPCPPLPFLSPPPEPRPGLAGSAGAVLLLKVIPVSNSCFLFWEECVNVEVNVEECKDDVSWTVSFKLPLCAAVSISWPSQKTKGWGGSQAYAWDLSSRTFDWPLACYIKWGRQAPGPA